jgi:hypothetical protein
VLKIQKWAILGPKIWKIRPFWIYPDEGIAFFDFFGLFGVIFWLEFQFLQLSIFYIKSRTKHSFFRSFLRFFKNTKKR